MQQVVTDNETKYKDVVGSLHKVASRLREPREVPVGTGTGPGAHPNSGVPLELKVSFQRCLP